MKKVLIAVLGYLVVQSAVYGAPAAPFQVLEPAPIVVRGVFDGSASEWSALIRVQAGPRPVEAIIGLPSDLLAVNDPTLRIERSNIALQNADALAANEIRDLRLVVRNVSQAGTYTGDIQFLTPSAPITTALTLPIRVEISPKESITPEDPAPTLKATTCVLWCPWSDSTPWKVYFDHQGSAHTAITTATIVLRGQHTGTTIAPSVIQATLPLTLTANASTPLAMTIWRAELPADQYTGQLRVQTRTGLLVAPIAFTLNVKHSVIWALLAIVVGIFCGRFVRFMQSPDVQRGIRLFRLIDPVRTLTESFRTHPYHAPMLVRIARLEQRIDDPYADSEALRKDIQDVHSRAIMLRDMQTQYETLQKLDKEATRAFASKFSEARNTVLNDSLEQAQAARDTLYSDYQDIVKNLSQAKGLTAPAPLEPTALPFPDQPPAATNLTRRQRGLQWLSSKLAHVIGIASLASAKARYQIYRPLAGAVFLLILIAIGLQAKYASAPTFGAQWTDYWDLFLWGLTADVVNRAVIGQLSSDQPA